MKIESLRGVRARPAVMEGLDSRRLLAGTAVETPVQVGDIDRTTDMLAPGAAVQAGKYAYFAGHPSAGDGAELFRTDGTKAGTVLVRDINPNGGSAPSNLTNFNGTLYFTASDDVHGNELYQSDGTAAGTKRVADLYPGTGSASPANLTVVGGALYFTAYDGSGSYVASVWRTDGTAAGTAKVHLPGTAVTLTRGTGLASANGKLLLSAVPSTNASPAASDGTFYSVTGTLATAVAGAPGGVIKSVAFGGAAYFTPLAYSVNGSTAAGDLWRSDGTAAGTYRVKAFDGVRNNYDYASTQSFVASGDRLYFGVTDGDDTTDLWRTDGTAAGTVRLTDSGTAWTGAIAVGKRSVLFVDKTAAAGEEPWVSDGTAAGTKLLKDLAPGTDNGAAIFGGGQTVAGGRLVFATAARLADPTQVWTTDGTAAGTTLVKTLNDVPYATLVQGTVNGVALLQSVYSVGNGDLYRSDGTAAGTYRIGATLPADGSSVSRGNSQQFVAVGDTVYFDASDGTHGVELYKTVDGKPPVRVTDIFPGGASSSPTDLTVTADGSLYFQALVAADGSRGLFRIAPGAGTATEIAKPGTPGGAKFWRYLSAVGNLLYFSGYGTPSGTEVLYRYDPSTGKSTPVIDTDGATYAYTKVLHTTDAWYVGVTRTATVSGNYTRVQRLYRLTSPTTYPQLLSESAASDYGEIDLIGTSGKTLYFTGGTAATGTELYKTDGTVPGTGPVKDQSVGTNSTYFDDVPNATLGINGYFYYTADVTTTPYSYQTAFRTDGTAAGTVPIAGVDSASDFVTVAGEVYFIGTKTTDGVTTTAIYRVVGTTASPVTRVNTGDAAFTPTGLKVVGQSVFVLGIGGDRARYELWRTDDRFETFKKQTTLAPYGGGGALISFNSPDTLLAATATDLYFPMYAPATGVEPYRLPLTPPPAATASIRGFAFDDANGNGKFDAGDKYTAGKTIFLDTDNDGVLDSGETSVVTGTGGTWAFTGLAAGTVHVRRGVREGVHVQHVESRPGADERSGEDGASRRD